MRNIVGSAYENQMAAAREAVKLKTDAEISTWLQNNKKDGTPVSPNDLDEFRATGQAKMQDLLDGKPSRSEFEKQFIAPLTTFSMKFGIMKKTITLFTVLWLAFGIASAYRIGSS
jgi:hypothetical protein